MRVLYVDQSIGFGGAKKALAVLLKKIQAFKVYPIVLIQSKDGFNIDSESSIKIVKSLHFFDYYRHGKFSRFFRDKHPCIRLISKVLEKLLWLTSNLIYLIQIIYLTKRHKVAIIHCNNGAGQWIPFLAAIVSGVPCIFHQRGIGAPDPIINRFKRKISKIIAVSTAVKEDLIKRRFSYSQVITVWDPVDKIDINCDPNKLSYLNSAWKIPNTAKKVMIVGRITWWKGQIQFVEAMENVMNRFSDVYGIIVGDGSDDLDGYEQAVIKRINQSKHKNRFILTGYQRNVEDYYCWADIVVHASIIPEPFGLVILEAMAAGKPVIATDAGGPRDIIRNGIDGILVPPDDIQSLSNAIKLLLKDKSLRTRLGQAAKKRVQIFSSEKHANTIYKIYRSILKN